MQTTASYENDKLISNATPAPGTTGKHTVVTREITAEGELITVSYSLVASPYALCEKAKLASFMTMLAGLQHS